MQFVSLLESFCIFQNLNSSFTKWPVGQVFLNYNMYLGDYPSYCHNVSYKFSKTKQKHKVISGYATFLQNYIFQSKILIYWLTKGLVFWKPYFSSWWKIRNFLKPVLCFFKIKKVPFFLILYHLNFETFSFPKICH